MNLLSFLSLILFLVYLQAGLYVLIKSPRSRLNLFFFLLCMCFSIWSFGYIFVYSAIDAETVLYWDKFASIGYILFPAFMLAFNMHLCHCSKHPGIPKTLFLIMIMPALFLIASNLLGYWPDDELVLGSHTWHFLHDLSSPFYIVYYTYLVLAASLTFFYLIRWRLHSEDRLEKTQFSLYFYPLLVFFVLAGVIDILLPALRIAVIPNFAHISSLPWIGAISFAMIKFRLMGINTDYYIAESVIRHLKEIVLFVDKNNKVVRTNPFTEKILVGAGKSIEGMEVSDFFENSTLVKGYMSKVASKGQIGPSVITMQDINKNLIETSLYFMALNDRYNDLQGYIIYGHDNSEALNLQKEIIVRQQAEKNLRAISEVLENRVKERTTELTGSYKELQVKMTERMHVEEQIKADIAEKEVLINEIHNRVKSNMNIIISLIMAYDKENLGLAASRKFKELARRVRSLLLVHQNLYLSINYSDVDFSHFIKQLANELLHFYKKQAKIEIRFEVSEVFLDVDYAIPMGIVVNELISNAFQHSFSDYYLRKHRDKRHIIHVEYLCNDGDYEISVSNNGKALPENFDLSDLTTNGLPLSEILINDQVGGELQVISTGESTTFKIKFHAHK